LSAACTARDTHARGRNDRSDSPRSESGGCPARPLASLGRSSPPLPARQPGAEFDRLGGFGDFNAPLGDVVKRVVAQWELRAKGTADIDAAILEDRRVRVEFLGVID
jgi:hypothetical protein